MRSIRRRGIASAHALAQTVENIGSPYGGGTSPIVPLTSIDADGWQATFNGTPPSTTINASFTATGISGFDSAGSAVTNRSITTGLRITRRIRNAGLTTLNGNKVGLSLKLPASAFVNGSSGNVNGSTQVVPVPVTNWVSRHGNVIGNEDVILQVVCGHYYAGIVAGEQVACVAFIITDSGSGSITKKTSTMVASSGYGDQKTAYVYQVTVTAAEMATLDNGKITYNCNVYPFIGTTASIARTSDAGTRGFPTWKFDARYDIKDPTRRASPAVCYLDAAGNNTTGIWSTTPATAAALPFLTMAGALAAGKISAIPAGAVLASGTVDGCEVRARIGTFSIAAPATSSPCAGARLIFTRDTTVATRSQAIYQHDTAYRLRIGQTGLLSGCEGGYEFRDCSYNRTAVVVGGESFNSNMHLVNVTLNMGAINTAFAANVMRIWYWGCAISNLPASSTSALLPSSGGSGGVGIMRGCTGPLNGSTTWGYNLIGNSFSNIGSIVPAYATLNPDNTTICFNILSADSGTTYAFDSTSYGQTISHVLIMGNVSEWTNTDTNPVWRISADGERANTYHFLEYHNSRTGFNDNGRDNDRYVDRDAGIGKTHTWGRSANNIKVQYNTKHDLFAGVNPANPLRIGGWEVDFGVGYGCNWMQFLDAGSGSFAPSYTAPTSNVGTSASVRNDPLFKINGGTRSNALAGLGGGDYRLQRISEGDAANSPCLTMAEVALLPGFGAVIGAYP